MWEDAETMSTPTDHDKMRLLLVRGHISMLEAEERANIEERAVKLRAMLTGGGEVAVLAYALVGAELAAGEIEV